MIRANGLNSKATIYVGQNLLIPLPGESPALPKASHKPALLLASANRSQPSKAVEKAPGGKTISDRASIPVSELSISPAVVGGDLEVERVIVKISGKVVGIIRAEIEETLGHYADWLKIPIRELLRLNGLRASKALQLHQQVTIPLDRVAKEQFEGERLEFHRKIQEDYFNDHKIENAVIYRVKNGDNIWTLTNDRFRMPIWLIKKYNPSVDFNDLRRSQKLAIPVLEKIVADNSDVVAYEGSDYLPSQ
jgi:membrane-bound lytic murein transglycosylase D